VSPPRAVVLFTTLGFLALIASAGMIQTAAELTRGARPRALDVFDRAPTAANLHEYEHALEDASVVAGTLRPFMQEAQFDLLADAGEKVLVGRDGWLFYRPGVHYATGRPAAVAPGGKPTDPLSAIRSFRDRLATRGIHLLVVPAPDKESVYPDRLSTRAAGLRGIVCGPTRSLLEQLRAEGVAVVDLFEVYRRARQERSPSDARELYLARDSHWSPAGLRLAVDAVARRARDLGWVTQGNVAYDERPAPVRRVGDLLQMLRVPRLERALGTETVECSQVVGPDGRPYRDAPDATVLVMGDSFLRIYERDEPGSAGFVAHLARALGQPLTSIINDGGASTLVRQELYRRPRLLAGKTLVIWEFVERDIRDGAEGWQDVPLPAAATDRR
jgi:SGNH hydrolase-like domain, acetyltransferase AlgX